MAIFATESNRFSNVVKHEYDPATSYCRDVVVVNDAAATFKVGAVLGKVTATGKYKLVTVAAVDGSQVASAVVIGDSVGNAGDVTIPATTDTNVLVLSRGPVIVSASALQLGADVDTAPEKLVVYTALKAVGIIVETTI